MAAVAHKHDDDEPQPDPAAAEREAVKNLTAEGHSLRETAEILGTSHQTVSNDVNNLTAVDAVAEMSEADFRIIERAHQLCDHPPAREMAAPHEACGTGAEVALDQFGPGGRELITHATKIMCAQIRAVELVREMAQKTCLVELVVDETDEPCADWAWAAQDAWRSRGWAQAAKEYRIECGKQRGVRQ